MRVKLCKSISAELWPLISSWTCDWQHTVLWMKIHKLMNSTGAAVEIVVLQLQTSPVCYYCIAQFCRNLSIDQPMLSTLCWLRVDSCHPCFANEDMSTDEALCIEDIIRKRLFCAMKCTQWDNCSWECEYQSRKQTVMQKKKGLPKLLCWPWRSFGIPIAIL